MEELTGSGVAFEFTISGLLKIDIAKYNLLPVVLKGKDPKAKDFVKTHGTDAAELDALPPDVLRQRVRDSIESCIDPIAWAELAQTEQQERDELDKHIDDMRRPMQRNEGLDSRKPVE